MTILEMGHLPNVGVCLDLGHAHITVGMAEAVATLGDRIGSVHVHDNHGLKDEHLWPGDGTIDWRGQAGGSQAALIHACHGAGDQQYARRPRTDASRRIEQAFALLA